jgi:hypothetical protein
MRDRRLERGTQRGGFIAEQLKADVSPHEARLLRLAVWGGVVHVDAGEGQVPDHATADEFHGFRDHLMAM